VLVLVENLYKVCEKLNFSVTCFNLGLHEDSIEIQTAEEHDEYEYHGSMGIEAKNFNDVLRFVESVKRQNGYYHKKTDEEH
jgi:hypothetical protein